jgi:hypothetical protein
MGIPIVLGLMLFTVNLFRTMRGKPGKSPAARQRRPEFTSSLPVRGI